MINVTLTPSAKVTGKKVRDEVRKELQGFSTALLANLVSETPIDKGRARRGWVARQGKDKVKLINRVPYIENLERNRSRQTQGQGIIKPALSRTQAGRKRRVR